MRQNFNEQMEREAQRGDEWVFGAITQDFALVPLAERLKWLPDPVVQRNNVMDTNGCASRSPLNILEAKLNWLYENGMHPEIKKWCDEKGYRVNGKFKLCDAFIEILSGTTPTGNSLKAPVDAIRKYGVIPAFCAPLEDDMTWEEYMDPARITQEMKNLGQEFLKRLPIHYEKVAHSGFAKARGKDYLNVAGHAWHHPENGIYKCDDTSFNHAFGNANNEIDAIDTYEPFVKRLDKQYPFFEWGYSLSITAQNPYPETAKPTLRELIAMFFRNIFGRNVGAVHPRKMTLKIVANGFEEKYMQSIADELKRFYAPIVNLDIAIERKNMVPKYDASIWGLAPLAVVEYDWYDWNISVPNLPYDAVMFFTPVPTTPKTYGGIMTFANCGPWETTVFAVDPALEPKMYAYGEKKKGKVNEVVAKHELSHAFYYMKDPSGATDRTHEHFYEGNSKRVLEDLFFGEMTNAEILTEVVRKLKGALVALGLISKNRTAIADIHPKEETLAEKMYEAAFASIGLDLSKHAPNERGCAEALSRVIQKVYPDFPLHVSTIKLNEELRRSPHFIRIETPVSGAISIFPTEGPRVGHCGVWGKKGWVMSNTSKSGKWEANYTDFGWKEEAKKRNLTIYNYMPI